MTYSNFALAYPNTILAYYNAILAYTYIQLAYSKPLALIPNTLLVKQSESKSPAVPLKMFARLTDLVSLKYGYLIYFKNNVERAQLQLQISKVI